MSLFDPQRQQFAPLATGTPMPFATGFQNTPLLSGQNPLLQMAVQPIMAQLMGQYSMSTMGFPDQNMYDHMRHVRLTEMQGRAMSAAAQNDQANYMRIVRAGARMTGTPWDQDRIAAAEKMTGAFAENITPMMAMMAPDALDAMNGVRGSAVVMAQKVFEGGRYRMDPLTGQMGMFGGVNDQNETVTQQLYRQMYEEGDLGRMNGVTAGQMGQVYRDMTLRGMIGSAESPQDLTRRALRDMQLNNTERFRMALSEEGIDGVASVDELSSTDLKRLARNDDVRSQAQTINTDKVRTTLEGYTGAIAAVKDIFGGQGDTQAPMAELLNMLDQLSNGNLAQLDPGKLENIVRTTHSLSEMTGITMDGVAVMQQHASAVGAQMGLESAFAPLAMQGAMAYRAAFTGYGMGATTAWGAYSADQATQADMNLRQGGNASASANRAAAFLRSIEHMDIQEGSDIDKFASALRSASATGETTWQPSSGPAIDVNMNAQQIAELMEADGLDAGEFTRRIGQKYANREDIFKYGLGDMARNANYKTDMRGDIGKYLGMDLTDRLVDSKIMDRDAAIKLSEQVGLQMSDELIINISDEDMADDDKRNAAMVNVLRTQLSTTEEGKKFLAQNEDNLSTIAESMYGNADEFLMGMNDINLNNARDLFNPETLKRATAARRQAVHRNEMRKAMAPLRRTGPLQKTVERMISDEDPELGEIVAEAFGGYDNDELNAAVSKGLSNIQNKTGNLGKMMEEIQARDAKIQSLDVNSKERKALEIEQDTQLKKYLSGMDVVKKMSVDLGKELEKDFGTDELGGLLSLDNIEKKQEKEVDNTKLKINEATIGQLADVMGGIGGTGRGDKTLKITGDLVIDEDGRARIENGEGTLNDPGPDDVPAQP